MASICSVTRMEPSSAPIPAPTRPLAIRPVMIGPVSFISENMITAGNKDLAPNRTRLSRVCRDRTTPVAAPAKRHQRKRFGANRIQLTHELGALKRTRKDRFGHPPAKKTKVAHPFDHGLEWFDECARILQPRAGNRLGLPSGKSACALNAKLGISKTGHMAMDTSGAFGQGSLTARPGFCDSAPSATGC